MSLFLFLLMLSAEAPPLKGTLCFMGVPDCIATTGTTIEVPADKAKRLFVWSTEDKRTVIVGALEPSATVLDVADASKPQRQTVKLSLRGQRARGWPAEVRFLLAVSKDESWNWTLPPESADGEIAIKLPAGIYGLGIRAPRHRGVGRRVQAVKDVNLGPIVLAPLPAIHGRVTRLEEDKEVPVEGAQVVLESGKLAATTNEQGAFRAELSEPLPKEILVLSPGMATQVVTLERLEAENDLGEIRLASGAKLTVNIDRPEELRSKSLRFRLLRVNEKRYEPTEIAKGEIAAGVEQKVFTDLSSGKYFVILEGDAELERLCAEVKLGNEDLVSTVEIRPFRLDGRVMFGEEPLSEGSVTLLPMGKGPTWRAKVPVDSEGRFGGVCWQTGRLSGFVQLSDGRGGLLTAESPELGDDPSEWTMKFRNRLIQGRIFDKESGAAIRDVKFELQTATARGRSYSSVKVAPSGEYEIVAWQDGTYDLIVTAGDHIPKTQTVELSDADESQKIDFALDRGSNVILEFVWPSGQRVVGAEVLEGVARDGHNPERLYSTDAMGRMTLRIGEGETRVLYVIPKEGSFAPVRVVADRASKDGPMRFEIPPSAGTLRLHLQDAEGKDTNGIVVMRYNGEWLPAPVTMRLPVKVSSGFQELIGLPSGAYELWAVRIRGIAGIPNTPPPFPPVRVGVSAGETTAELTVVPLP